MPARGAALCFFVHFLFPTVPSMLFYIPILYLYFCQQDLLWFYWCFFFHSRHLFLFPFSESQHFFVLLYFEMAGQDKAGQKCIGGVSFLS